MNLIKQLIIFVLISNCAFSHFSEYEKMDKLWNIKNQIIKGSFLMFKNDSVFIEQSNHEIKSFLFSEFTKTDQLFINKKKSQIIKLNNKIELKNSINGSSNKHDGLVIFILGQ